MTRTTVPPALPWQQREACCPRLLVSVRSAAEALAALRGGADVIDVKEPTKGPLGRPSHVQIEEVVRVVAGRRPVTVAWGELLENVGIPLPVEIAAQKVGLAGLGSSDWQSELLRFRAQLAESIPLVPVAYADAKVAGSPEPEEVIPLVSDRLDRWLVIDTFDKRGPSTVNLLGLERLADILRGARQNGVAVVLAGGLTGVELRQAAELRPQLVGVRGALCAAGRTAALAEELVESLTQDLASLRTVD